MKTEQEKKEERYLISETAKLVGVESHVLRYWEEELKLPIRRNELGHRYYTKEDVEQFREIRKLKEQGLQLKAIRTVLTAEGSMQILMPVREMESVPRPGKEEKSLDAGEKAVRLQMLLHGLISQAVRENNEELSRQIRETIVKEMDYQFRVQEEETQKREQVRLEREEEHFRKLDEALRQYAGRRGKQRDSGWKEAYRQQQELRRAQRETERQRKTEARRQKAEERQQREAERAKKTEQKAIQREEQKAARRAAAASRRAAARSRRESGRLKREQEKKEKEK